MRFGTESAFKGHAFHPVVMVALVATIHDFFGGAVPNGRQKKSWMVGTVADHDDLVGHKR